MDPSTEQAISVGPRVDARHPLTPLQQRVWTGQRLAPRSPMANMGKTHRIAGVVDPNRLVGAFDRVVSACDALRTVVDHRPGRDATAVVLHDPPRRTQVLELPSDEVAAWCRERIATPIDATTCAYDSVLLRHGDDDWTWWLDLHHVVTDAVGSMLVYEATAAAYADPDAEPAVGSFWTHVDPDDGDRLGHRAAERVELDDRAVPIAPYGPRGPRTTEVDRLDVPSTALGAIPDDAYRAFSAELTGLTLLAMATAIALSRLDGRPEIVLGIPVHHRRTPAARAVVGPLMDIHPLAVAIERDESGRDMFRRVHGAVLELLRRANRDGAPVAVRSLDAVVNYVTADYGDFDGLATTTSWWRPHHVEAAHPIRVHAYDYGDDPRLEVDLNRGLSTDGSHHSFAAHLANVLDGLVDAPELGVGHLDLLTTHDRAVIAALNPPPIDAPLTRPVHVVVAERLAAEPGRVVAEHDGVSWTGGDLDARADAVAGALRRAGVVVGDRVGIRMPRCLDLLAALHGVLRAGAAFVLLDPDDPDERHRAIADDAGLTTVVDDVDELLTVVGSSSDDPTTVESTTAEATTAEATLDDLAYVIYTSGSTGTPKGVPISHRGLADYLGNSIDAYPTTSAFVMPLYSAVVFDLTITSLFLPQLVGGTTVIVSGEPVAALSRIAADHRLTVLKATPSQLELLVRMVDEPLSLEVVIVGGEAFRRPVAEAVAAVAPRARIFNEYGPAEAVVGCMLHEWDPGHDVDVDVPIGLASPGAEIHLLDAAGRPVPVGAWGELYVWRSGMSAGYLHLPEATADRFAPAPAVGERTLYRTGDRARISNGVVVYGGRHDDQLSVGGVRLEPGEIEAALLRHPDVSHAVVRVWTPTPPVVRRCRRCGLGTDVPDVDLDEDDVCGVCRTYDRIEPQTRSWFRTTADLDEALVRARRRAGGDHDALHLLSGGKDSTYALYQLVERGWRVHALTLDNGYIADGAKENIRRSVADLGISHEFVSTEAMDEIFRDSLDRFANVCNGCYKTIYTLATARAHELGIPTIVTGLSRGQFFETRLAPHQFEADRFDPDEIDRTVLQARRAYHQTRDAVTELLPEQALFDRTDIDVLAEIEYLDFYRYVDVELADMYDFLERRAPWVRPADTGRSTNCLVNVVGIHTHRTERGYHNYAEPYSWDVRLGHKTRAEALDELDDEIDLAEIEPMLARIGYEPRPPEILTAWYQTADGVAVESRVLAAHLREILPSRAVPTAFVHVGDLPLAESTKLDVAALPPPTSAQLGSRAFVPPETATEAITAAIWARVLGVDRVGVHDDFFDLGGASLAALETVAFTEARFGVDLPDALVFDQRRLRDFAAAVDLLAGTAAATPTIDEPADGGRPLSAGEEAMLFAQRADPNDVRYNVTRLYTVPGRLDGDRLRDAVHAVVARHAPLHTAYDERRSVLTGEQAVAMAPLPGGSVDDFVARQRGVPFDLEHGPLVRVHVGPADTDAGTADGEGVATALVIGMHHISIDAGTFDLFWDELDAAYHGRPLPELATTYAAHGAWQRDQVRDRTFPLAEVELAEGAMFAPPVSEIAPASQDGYLHRVASVTTSELHAAASTTPFAAALSAVAVVLSAYRRDDLVELGVTASVKDHPDADALIGYFLNSLPLVVPVPADRTLAEVDAESSRLVAGALGHRTVPFADIVRAARASGRRVPDISHMLAYEQLAPAHWGDGEAQHRIVAAPTAVNELTFFVQERGDELRLGLEFRRGSIDAGVAMSLMEAFDEVLALLCRRPGCTVEQARRSLVAPDLTGAPLDTPRTVIARFLDHAVATPDAIAVADVDGNVTTAGELSHRGARLADAIDDLPRREPAAALRIGVCLPRTAPLLDAIVGIHLAGAVYVPIDPTATESRRSAIVRLAELDAVVVDADTARLFDGVATIDVDATTRPHDDTSTPPVSRALPDPDDPAYLIFTSGSTGDPAGVEVSHANLAASTAARDAVYDAAPRRFLVSPSIGFDSSVVGLFWPLATGATVVLPGDDAVHDVDRLGDLVADLDVSHVLMVPSLYDALLRRRGERLEGLAAAIVAGEACPASLVVDHHARLPHVALFNEYGPTEATVWATVHRCEPAANVVPIGRPIPGATARVADAANRSMGVGAVGELSLAGPGVVRGYLSDRSDDAFVDDGDRRWYRTGDLVHLDRNGNLVFAGRVDDQLNVGGLRVEPVEIENVMVEIDGITDAAVTAATVGGRASLVAHVVGSATAEAVRDHVAARLGVAAAPRRIRFHATLPRTPNGKIDRAAVAGLTLDDADGAERPDGGLTVEHLVGIWREALARPDVDADGDFFALGGDSLAAVAIVTALGEVAGRDVRITELLSASTPAAMARTLGIGDAPIEADGAVVLVTLRPGTPGGPTIVITPSWDDVMSYHALAQAVDDDTRVIAAVVADGTRSSGTSLRSIDDLGLASVGLVTEALADRPGPVVVLGWSIGGVAAYDLAARLAERHRSVAGVALIDTYFPGEQRHLWSNRWWKYKAMMRPGAFGEVGRELRVMLRRRLDKLAVRLGRRLLAWGGQPVETARPETTASGVPNSALDSVPAPTTLPVVLFAADTTNPKRTVHRWATVATDLRVVPLQGRHRGFQSIMGADRVPAIVEGLHTTLLASHPVSGTRRDGVRHQA